MNKTTDTTLPHPAGESLRQNLAALVPDLRGFARFLVRDRSAADDLVQETVVRALSAASQFGEGTNLRSWLFTILRHTHYEQSRRRRTEKRVLEQNGMPEESHAPAQDGQAALSELQRFLWALPATLREALVLIGAQGLSYEEAAIVCQVPEGTVKARVSRARAQLARNMERSAGSISDGDVSSSEKKTTASRVRE